MEGHVLVPGRAEGVALVLDEPLSFWGGLDPTTGTIVEVTHPQRSASVTGRILVMPSGRGSSSSSTVLAEALRLGTGPAGIVLGVPDEIIAIGSLVAEELYGRGIPVLVAESAVASEGRIQLVADAAGASRIQPMPPDGTAE